MFKKKLFYSTFLLFFLTLNCSSPPPKDRLRIAFHVCPNTIDPGKASDFISSTLICLIYEGLTRNLPDGSVELALAEKVTISPDEILYTFSLREACWTNGAPITAYDFEASWKSRLTPDSLSVCAHLFYPIKNCEAIVKKEKLLHEAGIRALDEKTLQIQLERPCPYFLSLTAFPVFLPVPSHLVGKNIDLERPFIGNGPFSIENMSIHSLVALKKNPSFWNKEHIFLEGIDIQIISHETTALHLFEQGKLDWIGGSLSPLPSDALPFFLEKKNLHSSSIAATTFCSLNTSRFPFNSFKLRKAFSLALNRKEIARQIEQIEASRYIPPALMKEKNKKLCPPFAPLEAKALLQEALQELDLLSLPPLTLIFRSNPADKQIAQIIEQHLQKTLGLEIKLQEVDYKTHREMLEMKKYDLSLTNWIAQYFDPMNIVDRFKDPKNPKNYPGWLCKDFNKQLELANLAKSSEERLFYIEKAEEIMAQEIPLIPLFHWVHRSLMSPRLQHLFVTPIGGVLFERAIIEL